MSLQERRRSERFNLGVPLTVQWTNDAGQRKAHSVTQDVSSGGLFFCLPEAIPNRPSTDRNPSCDKSLRPHAQSEPSVAIARE